MSLVAKLLKSSAVFCSYFFAVFFCSTATPIIDLFIHVFVFILRLGLFLFILLKGGWVSPLPDIHLSHLVDFSALIFLSVIWSKALLKQLSDSNQKWVGWV